MGTNKPKGVFKPLKYVHISFATHNVIHNVKCFQKI